MTMAAYTTSPAGVVQTTTYACPSTNGGWAGAPGPSAGPLPVGPPKSWSSHETDPPPPDAPPGVELPGTPTYTTGSPLGPGWMPVGASAKAVAGTIAMSAAASRPTRRIR